MFISYPGYRSLARYTVCMTLRSDAHSMRKFHVGNKIITLLHRTNLISGFYVFGTILLRKIWWFGISQSDKKMNTVTYL